MNDRVADLVTAPAAMVGSLAGRGGGSGRTRQVLDDLRTTATSVAGSLADRPPLRTLTHRRSRQRRRDDTLRLVRNVGAAVSGAVLAVDVASEIRRAPRRSGGDSASSRGQSTTPRQQSGSAARGATSRAGSAAKRAGSSAKRASSSTKRAAANR